MRYQLFLNSFKKVVEIAPYNHLWRTLYNIYDGSAQIFAHFGTLHQIVHSYNIVFLESAHCTEARKCQNGQVFFETAFDGFFSKSTLNNKMLCKSS